MTNADHRQFLIQYSANRLKIEWAPTLRMWLNESGRSDDETLPWPHFGRAVRGYEKFRQKALWRGRCVPVDVVIAGNELVGKQ